MSVGSWRDHEEILGRKVVMPEKEIMGNGFLENFWEMTSTMVRQELVLFLSFFFLFFLNHNILPSDRHSLLVKPKNSLTISPPITALVLILFFQRGGAGHLYFLWVLIFHPARKPGTSFVWTWRDSSASMGSSGSFLPLIWVPRGPRQDVVAHVVCWQRRVGKGTK